MAASLDPAALKKLIWDDNPPAEYPSFREILEKYSKIPPEDVESHILQIREKAWKVKHYPCIGRFSWIGLKQFNDPVTQEALARLTAPGTQDALLDLGCFVGQVVRKFAFDGVDPNRLYATDLFPEFIEIGFELFRDRDQLPASAFVPGDMLNPADSNLEKLDGKITLVHAAHFFHLFTWEDQLVVCQRIVRFLKPGTKDAIIFGRHIGSIEPGFKTFRNFANRYLHDQTTFQKLWDEVGEKTGTRWRVQMDIHSRVSDLPGFADDARIMRYAVRQVA